MPIIFLVPTYPNQLGPPSSLKDRTEERRAQFERMATLGKNFGVETYMLDVSDLKKVHPLLDTTQITNVVYIPNDGMWYRTQQNTLNLTFTQLVNSEHYI